MQIIVFGDSIAYGASDSEGGWVERLKEHLGGKAVIYNLSIPGESTETLLERFETEASQRADKNTVIIIAVGINDLQFIDQMHDVLKILKHFKDNVSKLIRSANSLSTKVFFVGLTPLDEKKTNPISNDFENPYINKYVKEYNQLIRIACVKKKARFIDVFDSFIKAKHEKLLEDGVHPNSDGHKLIFKLVKEALVKSKAI